MPVKQGDLGLLQHPSSLHLLESRIPARLANVWADGTPRVIPIWFHWNGREFVMASPPKAPKLKALAKNPKVAVTIDDNSFPHKVLLIAAPRILRLWTESCLNMSWPPSVILEESKARRGSNSLEV